jgi:hypothetical protein
MLADQLGMLNVNRTGMRFLVVNANFRQIIQNRPGFYFQIAGQLIDADLISF